MEKSVIEALSLAAKGQNIAIFFKTAELRDTTFKNACEFLKTLFGDKSFKKNWPFEEIYIGTGKVLFAAFEGVDRDRGKRFDTIIFDEYLQRDYDRFRVIDNMRK